MPKSSLEKQLQKKGTFVHILLLNEHFLELLFLVPCSSLFFFSEELTWLISCKHLHLSSPQIVVILTRSASSKRRQ